MTGDETRSLILCCSSVWGFGRFAVRCLRRDGHDGMHKGRTDGKAMVW